MNDSSIPIDSVKNIIMESLVHGIAHDFMNDMKFEDIPSKYRPLMGSYEYDLELYISQLPPRGKDALIDFIKELRILMEKYQYAGFSDSGHLYDRIKEIIPDNIHG
ncbi:hypothetical protein [uncultured Arcobacter sp.]|uniref:hypothetical protein n=1 Tax=uncultured Arcobacter sp. TaxID=165434 RepID=UPI002639FEA9|nr:hypothetical protein [uncultured Arcobacter sp.]